MEWGKTVTMWLVGPDSARGRAGLDGSLTAGDLDTYRAAVADLASELRQAAHGDHKPAERIISSRLATPEFAPVLAATPRGIGGAIAQLLADTRHFAPSRTSPGPDLTTFTSISLLAQIDTVWWGWYPPYLTDNDVLEDTELVDLDELARTGQLRFSFRHQAESLLRRAARSAERRTRPGRLPRTAGLRLTRAQQPMIAWLNQVASEFAELAPRGTPPLWVNSLTRSVTHQRHLQSLGYVALLPSSHCVGFAADIEMAWYRKHRAHRLLRGLLLEHQRADEINVIDEGQAWHVCLRPEIVRGPRRVRQPGARSAARSALALAELDEPDPALPGLASPDLEPGEDGTGDRV